MSSKETNSSSRSERFSGNFACFLLTVIVLFVAVSVSDAGFANSIDKITKNLDVALRELRDDMPVYTNYTDKSVYKSSTEFNPKGMAGLYNLTTKFINFVVEPNFLKKGECYDLILYSNVIDFFRCVSCYLFLCFFCLLTENPETISHLFHCRINESYLRLRRYYQRFSLHFRWYKLSHKLCCYSFQYGISDSLPKGPK